VRLVALGDTASPKTVQPHREGAAVLSMSLDIDGAGVVTSGDDGRVARTDARGEVSVLTEFPGRQADVLAVSPSGGLRAAADGREVRLLDRAGEAVGAATDHPSTVTGSPSTPKGSGSPYLTMAGRHCAGPGSSTREPLSSNGEARISASPEPGWHDGAYRHAGAGIARLAAHRPPDHEHGRLWRQGALDGLVETADVLATLGGDCVTAWSFTGGGPMGKPPLQVGSGLGRLVTSVAVHPKNPIVAAGFDEGQVIVCAPSRQEKVARLRWPDWERITALAWSRDGARLAVGTGAGVISLLDLSKGLSA
jgi:WD40 repeat protein